MSNWWQAAPRMIHQPMQWPQEGSRTVRGRRCACCRYRIRTHKSVGREVPWTCIRIRCPPLGGQAFSLSNAVGRFIALAACCLPPLFCVPPESKRGLSLRSPAGSAWQIDVFSCARRQIAENRICIYIASIFHVLEVISSSIFPSFLTQTRWLRRASPEMSPVRRCTEQQPLEPRLIRPAVNVSDVVD